MARNCAHRCPPAHPRKNRRHLLQTIVSASVYILMLVMGLSTPALSGRLDDEALAKGKEYLTPPFLQCGKSWYGVEAGLGQITSVREFNQPAFVPSAKPITQADTLNGVDWKGTLHFRAAAYRQYDFNQTNMGSMARQPRERSLRSDH